MANTEYLKRNDAIVIVGAGVFGLSTALELTKRGFQNITVIDRFMPPVVDGSSVDISRVIRSDYADPLYARMASEAIHGWQNEYSDFYHQSGFVMLSEELNNIYINSVRRVNLARGSPMTDHPDAEDIKNVYPRVQARLSGLHAYHNPSGGWANAQASIQRLALRCSNAGVMFVLGRQGTAHSLRTEGARVTGVNVVQGSPIAASQVILSTGAWTNTLVNLNHAVSASGQPVGFIKLTEEEAKRLAGTPVMINMTTGIFCFPPTPESNILKIARHGYGYATSMSTDVGSTTVSSPHRDYNNARNSFLPADAERDLRAGLAQLVPEFANHPWMSHRLCWYTDTPEGDFVVGPHPEIPGLSLATGGAGHAFKFLPILGKYIANCLDGTADDALREKWRVRPRTMDSIENKSGDGSRAGPPLRLLSITEQAKL